MVERISTGSFDFNDFLGGGYERDVITMIAGSPGSGKTNLSLLVACSQANLDKKVIFVDSEGGFSVERVKQIVGESFEKILEKIFLLEPTNFEEQKECFKKLNDKIKKGHADLIVIDGMAMLYRLEMGESEAPEKVNQSPQGEGWMIEIEIPSEDEINALMTEEAYQSFIQESA